MLSPSRIVANTKLEEEAEDWPLCFDSLDAFGLKFIGPSLTHWTHSTPFLRWLDWFCWENLNRKPELFSHEIWINMGLSCKFSLKPIHSYVVPVRNPPLAAAVFIALALTCRGSQSLFKGQRRLGVPGPRRWRLDQIAWEPCESLNHIKSSGNG